MILMMRAGVCEPRRLVAMLCRLAAALTLMAALPPADEAWAAEGPLEKRLTELAGPDGLIPAEYGSGAPEQLAVEDAVERFWDVSTDALTTADDSRLPEIMAGRALAETQALYRRLRDNGQVVESGIQPIAPIAFVELVPEQAIVYVEVRSYGVYREAAGGREVSSWPAQIVRQYYLLEPIDGVWKVTDTR